MQYFNTLPKVVYTDKNRVSTIYTNIVSRANIVSSINNNPLLYYTYDIQDEDTPEIVAHKYYGDSYRYWIVLYCNNMLDPQWDWPLSGKQFESYIADKYQQTDPYNEVHHYEKIITQYDENTLTTTTNVITIDHDDFDPLTETTNVYTLPTGKVSVKITKRIVTQYLYELEMNESKRNIKILNKVYAQQFEDELKRVMGS